jgi:hypothetical protein
MFVARTRIGWHCVLVVLVSVLAATSEAKDYPSVPKFPRPNYELARVLLEPAVAGIENRFKQSALDCWKFVIDLRRKGELSNTSGYLFDIRYKALIRSHSLFSVVATLDYFCAGAHPNEVAFGFVFDIAAGKLYDPRLLYRITDHEGNLYPEISDMIRQRYLTLAKSRGWNCDETIRLEKIDTLGMESVALAANGLLIFHSSAHAVRSCFGSFGRVTLPYEKLTAYLDPAEARRLRWKVRHPPSGMAKDAPFNKRDSFHLGALPMQQVR